MNTWNGICRLASDPQYRQTDGGKSVTTMRVAVPRYGSDKADFLNVVCFDRLAENCHAHLETGRQVAIEGSIRQQTWKDAETGENRGRIEIVARSVQFLGKPRQEGAEVTEPEVDAA